MNGNNVYISIGDGSSSTIIAGTKVNEIQTECETIEISGPNVDEWRAFIAKRKEWSFSTGYLVPAVANVADLLQIGTTVGIQIVGREGTSVNVLLQGNAIVKQGKQSFTKGKLAQGSWKFLGNGPLAAPAVSSDDNNSLE